MDFPKFFEQMFKNLSAGASARAVFPAQLSRVRRLEQGGPALHVLPADGLEHVLAPRLHAVLQAAAQLLQGRVDIADCKARAQGLGLPELLLPLFLGPKAKVQNDADTLGQQPLAHLPHQRLHLVVALVVELVLLGVVEVIPKEEQVPLVRRKPDGPVSRSSSLARVGLPRAGQAHHQKQRGLSHGASLLWGYHRGWRAVCQ